MSNDYTNPNTNPNILMAGILTLNDRQNAFESFCVPVFCDFIRNYSGTSGGPRVTSYNIRFSSIIHSGHFYSASSSPLLLYYSEALPTTGRILFRSFTLKLTGNCR